MGVGVSERRGGLGGAWAGKARPEPAGMCKSLSPCEERSGGYRSRLNEQTCAPSAPQTKVAAGTRIWSLQGQPSRPGHGSPPFPSISPPAPSHRPWLSNFTGGSRGRGERVPGAPRDALG